MFYSFALLVLAGQVAGQDGGCGLSSYNGCLSNACCANPNSCTNCPVHLDGTTCCENSPTGIVNTNPDPGCALDMSKVCSMCCHPNAIIQPYCSSCRLHLTGSSTGTDTTGTGCCALISPSPPPPLAPPPKEKKKVDELDWDAIGMGGIAFVFVTVLCSCIGTYMCCKNRCCKICECCNCYEEKQKPDAPSRGTAV